MSNLNNRKWLKKDARVSINFLWMILATQRPAFVFKIVNHANSVRVYMATGSIDSPKITICDEMKELLAKVPLLASKLNQKVLLSCLIIKSRKDY